MSSYIHSSIRVFFFYIFCSYAHHPGPTCSHHLCLRVSLVVGAWLGRELWHGCHNSSVVFAFSLCISWCLRVCSCMCVTLLAGFAISWPTPRGQDPAAVHRVRKEGQAGVDGGAQRGRGKARGPRRQAKSVPGHRPDRPRYRGDAVVARGYLSGGGGGVLCGGRGERGGEWGGRRWSTY